MKGVVAIGCLFLLATCKQKAETTKPTVQNIMEAVYASGKIKSRAQYDVYPAVSGILRRVFVTEGSLVKKGDVLMTLASDAPALNHQNARLSASYQSMQANANNLSEAQATIVLARARWQNDSLLLMRQQNLWKAGIGSRNELESRQLTVKNSATAYTSAILRYNELKRQLAFAEQQAKTALQISSTVAGDYSIRATLDGKVYAVNKEPGEAVNPQMPVAVIGMADAFLLELQVDEYDIGKIKLQQKVFVTMDSYQGQVFEATVTKIDPMMNERTRSVTVEAQFTKPPPALLPNLTVEANILIRTKHNVLTIPRNYLVDDASVLLQNGETKKVDVGLKDYQWAEIRSGLGANDMIKKPAE